MKSRLLLAVACCLSLWSFAQDTLLIENPTTVYKVNPFVQVFELPSEASASEALRQIKTGEAYPLEEKVNLGMVENGTYWVSFSILNQSLRISKFLELQNPQMDYVRLFEVLDTSKVELLYETGDNFRFAQRPIANRYFVFPLKIQKGETKHFIMQLDKQRSAVRFPLVLYDDTLYGSKLVREYVFLGLFFGVLFLVATFSLITGGFIRDRLFVIYGFYVLAFAFWFFSREGLTYAFITSNFPRINLHFYPMCTSLTVILLILYVRAFFNTKHIVPAFDKPIRFFLAFLMVGFVLWFVFPDGYQQYAPALFAIRYFILLITIVFAYTAAIRARKQFPMRSKLFMLGYSVFFIGVIVELLNEYGWLNVYDFVIPPIMLGYFVEMLALTFAMGSIILGIIRQKDQLLVSNQTLAATVQELELANEEDMRFIALRSKAVLDADKIRYIQSDDHYLEFYLADRDNPEIDRNSLSEIRKALPSHFLQIHRSTIVNLTYVSAIFSDKVTLRGGEELRLSRTFKKDLERRLKS